jgi:hypothetical protein
MITKLNRLEPDVYTLRRDGEAPFRFKGVRLGDATRIQDDSDEEGNQKVVEITTRLYRTVGGKFVAGVSVYNRTEEHYEQKAAYKADSLESLAQQMYMWDHDILAELFEDTGIADQFVEAVDGSDESAT